MPAMALGVGHLGVEVGRGYQIFTMVGRCILGRCSAAKHARVGGGSPVDTNPRVGLGEGVALERTSRLDAAVTR